MKLRNLDVWDFHDISTFAWDVYIEDLWLRTVFAGQKEVTPKCGPSLYISPHFMVPLVHGVEQWTKLHMRFELKPRLRSKHSYLSLNAPACFAGICECQWIPRENDSGASSPPSRLDFMQREHCKLPSLVMT